MFRTRIVTKVSYSTFLPRTNQPSLLHLTTLEKGIRIAEKQWILLRMRRISCFAITVRNHDILNRLVGNFMVVLLEVEEVVLVVLPSLKLITLQPLIKLLLRAILILAGGKEKNWKPSIG
jgi:hypothetical protein